MNVYSKAETDALSYMQFLNVTSQSATYTLTIADRSGIVSLANSYPATASVITVYLPASNTVAFTPGSQITFIRQGAGEVRFAGVSGVTVLSTASPTATPWLLMQNSGCSVVYLGTYTYWLSGHLKDSLAAGL